MNTVRKQPTTKTIFLQVIRIEERDSLWGNAEHPRCDVAKLRELFAKKEKASAAPSSVKQMAPRSCIDTTRERNVGIVLKCLRLGLAEIRSAIEEMDVETLSEEAIAGLLSIFPTADEQRKVRAASTEQKQTLCGQFFCMCAEEPHLENQLRCWLSIIRFEGSYQQLLTSAGYVTRACHECVESSGLREILRFLLSACNELNKDLPTLANARGFRVTDLPKFKSFTFSSFDASCDNPVKSNLLHFAAVECAKYAADVVNLTVTLQNACKVDLGSVRDDVKELAGHVSFVENARSKKCTLFLEEATKKLERLSLQVGEMNENISHCSRYFHFKEEDWAESLSSLTQFVLDVSKCS
jgi:hypothetical protein